MTREEAISVIADAVWLLCRGPQWLEEDRELIRTAAEVLRPEPADEHAHDLPVSVLCPKCKGER